MLRRSLAHSKKRVFWDAWFKHRPTENTFLIYAPWPVFFAVHSLTLPLAFIRTKLPVSLFNVPGLFLGIRGSGEQATTSCSVVFKCCNCTVTVLERSNRLLYLLRAFPNWVSQMTGISIKPHYIWKWSGWFQRRVPKPTPHNLFHLKLLNLFNCVTDWTLFSTKTYQVKDHVTLLKCFYCS